MPLVWERKDSAIDFVESCEVELHTIRYRKKSKCTQVVFEKGLGPLLWRSDENGRVRCKDMMGAFA